MSPGRVPGERRWLAVPVPAHQLAPGVKLWAPLIQIFWGHFQVKVWIPRSSVLQLLFKQYLRLVFFLPISAGNSYL